MWTGATGLEPATSGVTGHSQAWGARIIAATATDVVQPSRLLNEPAGFHGNSNEVDCATVCEGHPAFLEDLLVEI